MATIGQRATQPPTISIGRGLGLTGLLALLVALIAAVFLLRPQPQFAVDLQAPLETLPFEIDGVNQVELDGTQPYRWTTDYAFVQIRHAFHLAPQFLATLTIRSDRPDGPQPVTFLLNEEPLATTETTSDLRTYSILLPHQPDAEGSLRFAAATNNYTPPNDPRRLGFITTSWTITPQFATSLLGPLTIGELALVLGGGALLIAWLRWRSGRMMALAVGGSVPLALLALRLFYQPAPIPYTQLALLALLAVAALPLLTRIVWSALGLSIVALVITFSGALWPSWITDDALISFRYAQNLVAGNGLVYNVGERVEGYTNFLWTMLAALVLLLGGEPVTVSYYAGIVIALLLVGATFIFARRFIGAGGALAAAALLGTSHSLLLYTARGSGLEAGLFALLIVIGSYLFVTERPTRAGIAFVLATMTRPEGAMLLLIAAAVRVFERRTLRDNDLWRMIGVYVLIGLPFFAWRYSYYGDLLPNTFYAKTGGGLAQAWRGGLHAADFVLFAGGPLLIALLLLAALHAARTWRAGGETRRSQLLIWLVVGLYTAYIVAVGGDHFPGFRFFVPVLPFLAILLATGLSSLAMWSRVPVQRIAPAIAIVIAVLLSGYNLTRSTAFDEVVRGNDESVWLWREIGWWLADNGQPGESMAARGAGAIPYYSDHTTIDLLGLNDKHIARMEVEGMGTGVAGHEKADPEYVLYERQPTYIPALWADYFGSSRDVLKTTGLYIKEDVVTRYGRRIDMWKRVQ
jgi:arabinofuranosyltransferase